MEIIREKEDSLDSYLLDELIKGARKGVRDILIPAGGTPESFYRALRECSTSMEKSLRELQLWQIDEIISGPLKGHFTNFFLNHLGQFTDQLIKVEDVIHPPLVPYYSFLGLGVNGHVAFHEPHIPKDFSFGCVELGEETMSYLKLQERTWGLTFGLKTFLASEKIFLMVKGAHKNEILQRFLSDDPSVPAIHLKQHPNLVLLLDNNVSLKITENTHSKATA